MSLRKRKDFCPKQGRKKNLPPGKISNMDEGVVEGRINVSDTENLLAFANLGSERDLHLLNLLLLSLTWSHIDKLISKKTFLKFLVDCSRRKRVEKGSLKWEIRRRPTPWLVPWILTWRQRYFNLSSWNVLGLFGKIYIFIVTLKNKIKTPFAILVSIMIYL